MSWEDAYSGFTSFIFYEFYDKGAGDSWRISFFCGIFYLGLVIERAGDFLPDDCQDWCSSCCTF